MYSYSHQPVVGREPLELGGNFGVAGITILPGNLTSDLEGEAVNEDDRVFELVAVLKSCKECGRVGADGSDRGLVHTGIILIRPDEALGMGTMKNIVDVKAREVRGATCNMAVGEAVEGFDEVKFSEGSTVLTEGPVKGGDLAAMGDQEGSIRGGTEGRGVVPASWEKVTSLLEVYAVQMVWSHSFFHDSEKAIEGCFVDEGILVVRRGQPPGAQKVEEDSENGRIPIEENLRRIGWQHRRGPCEKGAMAAALKGGRCGLEDLSAHGDGDAAGRLVLLRRREI